MDATTSPEALAKKLDQIARRWGDDHFDEQIGLIYFAHPKNLHMSGAGGHLLRESAYYAYLLLRTGQEQDRRRASKILGLVLSKQNLDHTSPYWAGFTCEFEQEWETWEHPDQNWTQFLGMSFAYVLQWDLDAPCLEDDLRAQLGEAFRLTVLGTIRRDVHPEYTNIALLSAAVAAAGDRLQRVEGAEAFAWQKLAEVRARAEPSTTFDEYLSPTYYGADLFSLYSAVRFARTERVRSSAQRLLDLLWDDIERAYHPPTFQLGGPQSRAYGEDMVAYAALIKFYLFLALEGNYPVDAAGTDHSHDCQALAIISTHRVERRLSAVPRKASFHRVSLPAWAHGKAKVLSQYQDETFSLGTVSEEDNWSQRRNLLFYWRAEPGGFVGIGKGWFVHEQKEEFNRAMFFSSQWKTSVLVGLRVAVADAPDGAFCYRLEFNAAARQVPDSRRLDLPGLELEVVPIAISGPGSDPRLEVTGGSGSMTRLEWRWQPAAASIRFYEGAFVLAFKPAGVSDPPRVTGAGSHVDGGAVDLTATVDGEPLTLTMPVSE